MFSGTLNVGNVHFYFPDSSVLSRGQVLQCGLSLFVAPTSLDVSTTHTSQLFSALTLNTKSIWTRAEIWWTVRIVKTSGVARARDTTWGTKGANAFATSASEQSKKRLLILIDKHGLKLDLNSVLGWQLRTIMCQSCAMCIPVCDELSLTIPKIWTIPNAKHFYNTKKFWYQIRYFWSQIFVLTL